jgi:flagellar hook-associated protein 2
MAISSSGIGSGLPVDSIVSKLMAVEQQPITALQKKETSYTAQLTAYGTVQSSLSTFQSAVNDLNNAHLYNAVAATVGDSSVLTASTGTDAAPGNYSLTVSQLAQAQKLASAGQASATTAIGNGTLTFDFGTINGTSSNGKYTGASFVSNGDGAKTITIDSSNNTLTGIMNAINSAQMGVTATIINDGGTSPYRLSLTSTSTGEANSMKISVGGGDAALTSLMTQDPAGSQAMIETSAAKNAELTIDGVAVSKASNTVTDAIAGVTLNLQKTNVGSPTSVSVALNSTAITTAVNKFVSSYNALNSTLTSMTAVSYDETTSKATSGALGGDLTTQSIQTALRRVLTTAINGGSDSFSVLSDIGVTVQKDGTLATDNSKLQAAINNNYTKIAGLFASVGNTTDGLSNYDSATANTKPGAYAVNVSQVATQARLSGSAAAATTIVAGVNDTLTVNLDGIPSTITLDAGTYASPAALAAQLQTTINGVNAFSALASAVTVTADGSGVLNIRSNRFGAGSAVAVSGDGAASLFGIAPTSVTGVDVEGSINGVPAVAVGQYLTGAAGDPSEGLKIKVTGGGTGDRGTVSYSKGYADQFSTLLTAQLDATKGPIATRTAGINQSLKTMDKTIADLTARNAQTEARYRAKFSALDTTMSNLSATSTSLAAQLAKLS